MTEFKAGLYIVSTPIGNMGDITVRAIECLKYSNIILCEDTRITQKLLQKHEIYDKKLWTYNDHSTEFVREKIIENINQGKIISLVSDAGTPLIADPGYKLVRELQEQNIHHDIIPGVSASISALTLSGLPTDKFFFYGFMPKTTNSKEKTLSTLKDIDATLIFYDTANRIQDSLQSIYNILGNREVAIAREITKIFQQTVRANVLDFINKKIEFTQKGEFVLLVSKCRNIEEHSEDEIKQLIISLKNLNMSKRDIANKICEETKNKCKKNTIYKLCEEILDNNN